MNRSDDYGRRRRPDEQYGGGEEGYGHVPGGDRTWRRRDLSAGRYGNAIERNPYDAYDDRDARGWPDDARNDPRDANAWRRGRTAQLSGGWRSRGATVFYPGRETDGEALDESSPHSRGYVTAYSSGYEDGYQAGARSSQESPSGPPSGPRERWAGTRTGYASGYEDYGVAAGHNFRQRSRGSLTAGSARGVYGNTGDVRPAGPKNYTRSDERIHEEVCERLAHTSTLDVSDVTVAVSGGVVTLTGSVDNRRIKYEVEDIADDTYGVTDVVNQIHVRPYGVLASE